MDVETLAWKGTYEGISVQIVVDRIVDAGRPGEIVPTHVGSNRNDHTTLDAQALPTLIARLRGLGYGFVTLDVCRPRPPGRPHAVSASLAKIGDDVRDALELKR